MNKFNPPSKFETVVIDIPNKKFEINGVPIDDTSCLHISFENGEWSVNASLPHIFVNRSRYDIHGELLSEERHNVE